MKQFTCWLLLCSCLVSISSNKTFQPNWESLDSRKAPSWYDEAKIGIFIHWGVYSVPAFGEWFWWNWQGANQTSLIKYMFQNYPSRFTYQEFAPFFTADQFSPTFWAKLFALSGARYVVLTSKHHEGYLLGPSKYSWSWNAQDVGPHTDLISGLAKAVRKRGLRFGLYYSLYEWFNPLYLEDKRNSFKTQKFVNDKLLPEMKELVNTYRPSIWWSDGDWETTPEYWKSQEFLAWLYNDSPVKDEILVNDRWGIGSYCTHGDFYACQDRYNPGVLQDHKWENAMTLDRNSWGYRRNANILEYLTIEELLQTLAETISTGGNILINVGPARDGTIAPIFQERLLQLGKWLSINGEAIYSTQPWTVQNDTLSSGVWYTTKNNTVYAIVLQWPKDNVLFLKSVAESNGDSVALLGYDKKLLVEVSDDGTVKVNFPDKATVKVEWAWVLKFVK